ncbi:LysR family transcriptional regulator [Rhizobium panacihumi]|uniref:LysR family transcriptional regulator n=1 Tax=Rhizobium panacihumi TaxID=2008450 RepID=UPI003D7B12B2
MELRHVRYFLAIAQERSFTRAAEYLGIAQPPLSQQMKVMEREIGTSLFRRLSHGVELTPAGYAFRQAVSDIPTRLNEGIRLARRAAAGESGVLRIGVTGTTALNPVVPACIRAYKSKFPSVDLMVTEANSVALSEAVLEDRLDVAILRPSGPDPDTLRKEVLSEEPLMVALATSHRLADAASIDLLELATDPFILTPREVGTSLHDAVVEACQGAGFTPLLGPAAPHIASILSLVSADLGVSLVPRSISQVQMQGTLLRPLTTVTPVRIAVAYRKGSTSPTVRNFLSVTRNFSMPRSDP